MDQYIGKWLDNRYELLERIGTGGMAVVYKARCHRLNRLVAVKILKPELAGDAEFRRRIEEIYPYVEELYSLKCDRMVDFNMASIRMLITLFDIEDIEIKYASEMSVAGKSNELIVNLVKAVGCRRYLSGIGARDYFIPEPYERNGIEVIWQEFEHPVYKQQFGEFIPYLSSIDLLFNCGINYSREVLRDC